MRPDQDANQVLYGKKASAGDLLLHRTDTIPRDAGIFIDELNKISPKKKTS